MKTLFLAALLLMAYAFPEDKHFVIVIPSYNNEKYCDRNLESVFKQDYPNYRVIYIDDYSSDHNLKKVEDYVALQHQENRFTLIKNPRRLYAAENFYRAIHSCRDDEIIVFLDGDDWLAHPHVLTKLNTIYANPDIWLTFGSYMNYPGNQRGECAQKIPPKIVQSNTIRQHVHHGWILSHLRTCYAALFKQIKLQDAMMFGRFLKSTSDQAFMLPMVEMAGEHAHYIEEILYVYNRETPLNDDKISVSLQQACKLYVWGLPPYAPLDQLPLPKQEAIKQADLVILSSGDPCLNACLESIQKHAKNIGKISVVSQMDEYDPHSSHCQAVAVMTDHYIMQEPTDFHAYIHVLDSTFAHALYFHVRNPVEAIEIDQGIYAWQFDMAPTYQPAYDMVLFKKIRDSSAIGLYK